MVDRRHDKKKWDKNGNPIPSEGLTWDQRDFENPEDAILHVLDFLYYAKDRRDVAAHIVYELPSRGWTFVKMTDEERQKYEEDKEDE